MNKITKKKLVNFYIECSSATDVMQVLKKLENKWPEIKWRHGAKLTDWAPFGYDVSASFPIYLCVYSEDNKVTWCTSYCALSDPIKVSAKNVLKGDFVLPFKLVNKTIKKVHLTNTTVLCRDQSELIDALYAFDTFTTAEWSNKELYTSHTDLYRRIADEYYGLLHQESNSNSKEGIVLNYHADENTVVWHARLHPGDQSWYDVSINELTGSEFTKKVRNDYKVINEDVNEDV